MAKKRRIRTHAPKIAKNEAKKEESTYHMVKRHHKERAEKQAKMRGETKKQEFDSIAHLHGALGNKKITELHRSGKLMAMLKMSKPGDRYEREADQIASQVMNTNPGTVHENSSAKVAPKVDLSKVNKKKGSTTTTQIKNLSGGEKMDGGTKKFFKSRFDGLDLSKVNIHKGRKANKMANSINARAFTYGNNIVFNKGEYKPNTFQGKKLLAHELAHVAQQTGAQPKKFSRKIKMDEPGKKVNAGNITDTDRMKALENFGKRHKFKKVEQPQAKTPKKNNITKIDKQPITKVEKPAIIKEESVNRIQKSEARSVAPPVKVSSTQGKVVMGWWGKKKDDDKEKEEEDKDGKKPKGIGGFAWWAFKNLLGLIGIDVDQFTAILSKAGDALGAIIKDPKGFFGNLGKAVKGGINNFVGNFKKHLLNGIAGWLFGNLGDAGLELPSSFDFKGILSIVLQVLGLTYGNIRGQIVKSLGKGGEEMMSHGESMFEHLKTAITQGPMALWEQLKEHLSGLKDQFFGMIIDWVKTTVIKQGVMFLISMLNPAGALVQAVRAIIKVVTFFMERWQQIQDFASSVVDSVSLIAKGDVTAAQNGVENSLAKAMPITISFIAKLVGLGGISKHIKKVIKKIQKPINNAIKKVVGKFAKKIKSLPIFKKGKKALNKGKKKLDQAKKKVKDVKEGAEQKVKDKANAMKDKVEKSRADKQKKKEKEAKDKSRKGKNKHEKKEQLKEDDKKKHKKYVAEIVQKLQADKGNNAKSFKEFHASKVKLVKDLEGRYQKKLKRGINIDITIPPLEKDKKDNDVDFKIKIAPNSTEKEFRMEFAKVQNQAGAKFKLAPGTFSEHEGTRVIIDDKIKTVHLLERHGEDVEKAYLKERLTKVCELAPKLRAELIKTWRTASTMYLNRLHDAKGELIAKETELQMLDRTSKKGLKKSKKLEFRIKELKKKIDSTNELYKPVSERLDFVENMDVRKENDLQELLEMSENVGAVEKAVKSVFGKAMFTLSATKFSKKQMDKSIYKAIEENQDKIDDFFSNNGAKKCTISHRLDKPIGDGFIIKDNLEIEYKEKFYYMIAVLGLVKKDSNLFKVFTAYPNKKP